jgi:uncharacterized protein YbjT (DUF2867 family)
LILKADNDCSILVAGATGYVGGRLVPELLRCGYSVRCIVREPRKLSGCLWRNDHRIEIVQGDLSDPAQLAKQLEGCSTAFYLIHSLVSAGPAFVEKDLQLARSFAEVGARAGLDRIIYLGGLGELGEGLSDYQASRRKIEQVLASTGVPVTTLRAALIIGAGSASFEILRSLVECLPLMITPRWVQTDCQPIAIDDVLYWLIECLRVPKTIGRSLEIGGPDIVTYRELMQITAEELGLPRRLIVGVPVLTPRLSSAWISLFTPVSYRIARPLADGLRNRVVVTKDNAEGLMPHQTFSVREAVRLAISITRSGEVPTRWSAAGPMPSDPDWVEGKIYVDQRSIDIDADAYSAFAAVCRVGGGHGWYAGDILWRIRGWMDQIVGGPGLRRGRRHAEDVEFGEALDFWRVIGVERGKSLLLHAEMKVPGIAQLGFLIEPGNEQSTTRLTMTARFRPKGFIGVLYWYAVVPLHNIVFGGMLNGIKRAAEANKRPENKTRDADSAAQIDVESESSDS